MHLKKLMIFAVAFIVAALAAFILYEKPASKDFPKLDSILDQFAAPGLPHADPAICIDCHQEAADKWKNSHHALANAPLSEVDRERLDANEGELLESRNIRWHDKPDTVVA
jgi:hypothetical protein